MDVALLHKHYSEAHLEDVKAEMVKRGAPVIRAIWSENYGIWLAVEGCHRLRAAAELGLTPVIKDVSETKTLTVQDDGENVKVKTSILFEELNDAACYAKILTF